MMSAGAGMAGRVATRELRNRTGRSRVGTCGAPVPSVKALRMPSLIRISALAAILVAHPVQRALAQADGAPTLVVMIVVDQLGGGLVDRYEPALTGGGFRRFMDQGRRYTQASHAHAMPETAPGHATLATGVFPARHGIVSNSWHQRRGFDWQLE